MENTEPYQIPDPLYVPSPLPEKAKNYLKANNQRLVELKKRYGQVQNEALKPSVWDDNHTSKQLDLSFFRGDNAYVWQKRDNNEEVNYLITAYYYQSIDQLGLLETLEEDNLFGIFSYPFKDGKLISRDLLDSIGEILFLEQTIGISKKKNLKILDIGAGYGRLAHRMVKALPNLEAYYCVDAVPESTFISEYYLDFRAVPSKAKVWCLDEIEAQLATEKIDLALNIHSFSECTSDTAKYWLDLLKKYEVPYLMMAPNPVHEGGKTIYSKEMDGTEPDLLPTIEAAGYVPVCQQPKYSDPGVQKYGVTPTWHHLFQLKG